jgi:diaminopimelate epimerase
VLPSMKFEKWQALGNDYVIVAEGDLDFPLTPKRIRKICASHLGVGSDGVILISPAQNPEKVASLRIFNPDGSEAELSGNGARQAVLYLRHNGFTDQDNFVVETTAGDICPQITGPTTATVDMGQAQLQSSAFPSGNATGQGVVEAADRKFRFQHVTIGNPQCAIELEDDLRAFDLGVYGPAIESNALFPSRTNVSFWRFDSGHELSARIFERGVGETMSSGTGACGAAVAAVLRGGQSPVVVHLDGGDLEVAVDNRLRVWLNGWAVCVYAGVLSKQFVKELDETE